MQRRIVHSFHNTLQTCILTTSQRSCWNAGTIVCFYMRIDARPLRETGFYCFTLANMATVTWSFKYYIYNPPLCNAKYIYSGVVRCGVADWGEVWWGAVWWTEVNWGVMWWGVVSWGAVWWTEVRCGEVCGEVLTSTSRLFTNYTETAWWKR